MFLRAIHGALTFAYSLSGYLISLTSLTAYFPSPTSFWPFWRDICPKLVKLALFTYQSFEVQPQKGQSPIIVDDTYDLLEKAALSFGDEQNEGLVAKADSGAALLYMSGYGKSHFPDENDYDTSRSLQDPMYLAYAQPGFAQNQVQPSSITYDRNADQVPYASSLYQPRATYEATQSPFADFGTRKVPEITSYAPQRGPQGSDVSVYIQSLHDFTISPRFIVSLMFATRRCGSTLTRIDPQGPYYQYVLTAKSPPLATTGWPNPRVPLRMQVYEESGIEAGVLDVGEYTYMDGISYQPQASPQDLSRKRKISIDSAEGMKIPSKRTSNQQLQGRGVEGYGSSPYVHGEGSAYPQVSQPITVDSVHGSLASYGRSESQQSFHQSDSSRRVSQNFSASTPSSQSHMKIASPRTPSWSPAYTAMSKSSRAPGLTATSASRISAMPSPSASINPPLIRTSTLQQSPSPAVVPAAASTSGSFNPYAMYPHKAVLKISGDLDSMAEDWSADEWAAKRRIVQFWRSQSGSTINTNFKPVAPEDRPPNSICISCIWWEERNECYVTSVDTIYLLESLVAVRFTVEEKNRIRRNLEGFRPMTVSKAKSDSEDFFKVIMGFPNPKPRNIEKDVKVFPWKILAHALKKIIGKYSASYSSTAGALLTPVSSAYAPRGQSEPGTGHRPTASPHSASSSLTCSAYSGTLTSTTMSPNQSHGRLSAPIHFSEPRKLQSQAHAYSAPPLPYQYTHQQMTPSSGQLAVSMPPGRGSWDFASFMENSPTMENSSQAPSNPLPARSREG